MFVFFVAIGYSLIGRKRVLVKSEALAKPLIEKLPEEIRPYFYLALVSITAALIPLILLVLFSLVKGVIDYDAPWFILIGKMLGLWSIGALLMSLVSGIVDRGILEIRTEYAGVAVRLIRAVILYILVGIAVLWSAGALRPSKGFSGAASICRIPVYCHRAVFGFSSEKNNPVTAAATAILKLSGIFKRP